MGYLKLAVSSCSAGLRAEANEITLFCGLLFVASSLWVSLGGMLGCLLETLTQSVF